MDIYEILQDRSVSIIYLIIFVPPKITLLN